MLCHYFWATFLATYYAHCNNVREIDDALVLQTLYVIGTAAFTLYIEVYAIKLCLTNRENPKRAFI